MHCNRRSDRAGNHTAHRQPGAVSEYGGLRHARARTAWRDHSLRVGQNPLESKARIAVIDTVSFALGHKRTFRIAIAVSALPPKADIPRNDCFVRFGPKADYSAVDGIPNCACHWCIDYRL